MRYKILKDIVKATAEYTEPYLSTNDLIDKISITFGLTQTTTVKLLHNLNCRIRVITVDKQSMALLWDEAEVSPKGYKCVLIDIKSQNSIIGYIDLDGHLSINPLTIDKYPNKIIEIIQQTINDVFNENVSVVNNITAEELSACNNKYIIKNFEQFETKPQDVFTLN